jgi:hypothetical protein
MKKIYTLLLLVTFLAGTGFHASDTGLNDNQPKITRFYPSPASSYITFEFQRNVEKIYALQIYSFIGNKTHEVIVTSNKVTVSLDGYFRGLYQFQLRDKAGNIIESGKFLVVK